MLFVVDWQINISVLRIEEFASRPEKCPSLEKVSEFTNH